MKTPLVLTLLILLSVSAAQARSTNDVIIEGVSEKNAKAVKDLINKNVEDPEDLNQLQKAMAAIYNTGLYNDIEIYFENHGSKNDVIFKLYPVRVISNVQFQGNATFASSDLLNELGINEGDGYSPEKVKSGVEAVKKYYNLNGYLNATVSGEFSPIPGTSGLTLTIAIHEGPPCTIDQITFRSVNDRLDRTLEGNFKSDVGKSFSQTLLTDLQHRIDNRLFEDKFLSATVSAPESVYDPLKTKVTLNYVINDPYSFSLMFEGNNNFDGSLIEKELDLSPENRLSSSPVDDLTERILRFYKKQGYASVAVKFKENLLPQDYERRIVFSISEGPKVRIREILFDGSFFQKQKYYVDFLFEHSGDLVSSHIYNSEDIDRGAKNLVIELQNQGFISAKITGIRTDFDKRHETAVIHVTLDEGPRTFVDKISFNGAHSIGEAELEKTIGLQPGAPLDLAAVESSSNQIQDLYKSKGYLDVQVVNQGKTIISYSAENTKATLTYEITEGPQITVSSIVIEGNTFTKEYVIRRELQFHPGEVLTPKKLAYSEDRLQRLGLFTTIDIRTLEEDPTQGNRTVLVKVAERPPGVFKGGVGVNNDLGFTLKGYTGFAYRNLFGTGRGITTNLELEDKVTYNFYQGDLNLSYTEPFAFDTNNLMRVTLDRSRNLWWSQPNQAPIPNFTWALDTSQGDVSLERDINQQLKLIYKLYDFAHLTEFEIYGQTTSSSIDIATTGPTLIWDRRNNPFNPTRGDISSVSLEFSSPTLGSTGTVDFIKGVGKYTRYNSFGPVVWANEVQGGYAENLSTAFDGAIPAVNAFVLGGPSTIRGFDPITESIPLRTDFPIQTPFPAIPSNTYFVLTKSEVRFPIAGNLGLAIFYDGGKVGFQGYDPQFIWRDSAGIGLRYNTPVGPVSLDYAYKLERELTRVNPITGIDAGPESPGQLLFSFGVF